MERTNLIIALTVICMLALVGCFGVKYNNTDHKNDIITETYSVSQIDDLYNRIFSEGVSFSEFKRDFKAQCVRKTPYGYYVVLSMENNKNAYIFMDRDNNLYNVAVMGDFKTKGEFKTQISAFNTKSDVLDYDSNTVETFASRGEFTFHHVQEGVYIIEYTRLVGTERVEDPVIVDVRFVDNQTLFMDEFPNIPCILEIDKVND